MSRTPGAFAKIYTSNIAATLNGILNTSLNEAVKLN